MFDHSSIKVSLPVHIILKRRKFVLLKTHPDSAKILIDDFRP